MKNIFSLIAVGFIIYIFTFYVDGEMGIIIIAFLLAAPIFSIAFALYGKNRIHISVDCDSYVKKGSYLEVAVIVEKEGIFPLPIVEIKPLASEVFNQNNKIYRLSLLSEKKSEFKFKLMAEIGGNGEVSIASVHSCGFLGFIKFKITQELPPPKSIGVIPEIPEITSSSNLFRTIADAVLTSEDDEENDTAMLFSANTSPGYEHREYVQGDSLRRINWKLSSKVSKVMVRLDEAASAVQPCFVLDLYRNSNCNIIDSLKKEEKLLQSVFGLITLLIKQGIASSFIYRDYKGNVISENIDSFEYPAQLLIKILTIKVKSDSRISVNSLSNSMCACIIAATDTTGDFCEIVNLLPDKEKTCAIVPDNKNVKRIQVPIWYLTDDNNFELV